MASPISKAWKPSAVRANLRDVQAALRILDLERKTLLTLIKGYKGWLSLYGDEPEEPETDDAVS